MPGDTHPGRLISCCLFVAIHTATGAIARADDQDKRQVGVQRDGRILVPTNQFLTPAGKQVAFPGRPVDIALVDEGRMLVAKNMNDLVFIDPPTATVKQILPLPKPLPHEEDLGFSVTGLLVDGSSVYATDTRDHVRVAERQNDGTYRWGDLIPVAAPKVGGVAHPAGMAWSLSREIWITSTRGNMVQRLGLGGTDRQTVPVGVAPYTLCFTEEKKCYVSNWGGDPPRDGDAQGESSKTPIRVDPKNGVANQGTVSVLSHEGDGKWKQIKTISVGLHPCGMVYSQRAKTLLVANANSDTVSVIDTGSDEVVETIGCRPLDRLPFGSGSNALALSPDGDRLYVANGTNNCIAVVELGDKARGRADGNQPSKVLGLIPTGWYPGAIRVSPDGNKLYVANIKGHGSLQQRSPSRRGRRSKDHLGTVSIIDVPDDGQLVRYTEAVNANNRLAYSLAGLEKPRASALPVPVPERHGERSVIQHVFYIIKENRTYDQIFGDMKEGNGDAGLVLFGEDVTPNQHALARQFTLFDNFYCSGVLSADGHSWVNEAYVTDYLERAFGGWVRSYPDHGDDPLAYPETGFLWDNALAHGRTVRNYGEFVNLDYAPKGTTWTDGYNDFKNGTNKVPINIKASLKSLEPYTHPRYPWFPLLHPDVYRAKVFIDDLKTFEEKGKLANLIYLTLPCNHTEGTKPQFPTPRAMAADNDLALGQIVEAITHSSFWPRSCIFVVEDDPQDGFDHVDGHRTVALLISPYTRRHFVDHTNYNQTGMVKTIELILGLPPMNQLDLSATPMRNCFQDKADLMAYSSLPNRVPLAEMNPPVKKLHGKARYWAEKSLALKLDKGDEADEDTLNRILWHSVRGYDTPYPEKFAGGDDD